jgi:hypothetical protein
MLKIMVWIAHRKPLENHLLGLFIEIRSQIALAFTFDLPQGSRVFPEHMPGFAGRYDRRLQTAFHFHRPTVSTALLESGSTIQHISIL